MCGYVYINNLTSLVLHLPPLTPRSCSPAPAPQGVGRTSSIFPVIAGSQYPIFRCVHRSTHEEVPDSYCDPRMKPTPEEESCSLFPCPAL